MKGILCFMLCVAAGVASAQQARSFKDVVYATANGTPLALDLYMPANVQHPPLVVYLHGGAWKDGDKAQYPAFLVERGFAVASLDFRSTNVAPFPADVQDIKAGIRFLRAKAAQYGYKPQRIALAGASSGAHLANEVGMSGGNAQLEGTLGDYAAQSSRVQAIVSYFGASDLTTILAQSTPFGISVRQPALVQLLGAPPERVPDLAKLASPFFQVDKGDPPLLLLHGDQDVQMPINQSHELEGAYRKLGLDVDFMVLHGVGHVGGPFFEGEPADRVVTFLKRTIGD
ncbi:MAG: alpha/beta hydrolase [Pseudomonadota bacterium]